MAQAVSSSGETERGYECPLFPGWTIKESRHFAIRRKARDVRIPDVRETLRSCDSSAPCREKDKIRIVKTFGKNHVHVIALQQPAAKVLWLLTVMVLPTGEMIRDEE